MGDRSNVVDTDRVRNSAVRERLEAIRRAMDAGYRHHWWTREVRLLLPKIDRLKAQLEGEDD